MMSVSEMETAEARAAAAGGDEKRAYVQRIFSEIAPRYDLLNHLLSLNIDKGWRRQAIDALDWQQNPSGTYVDLCAGTLDISVQLAKSPRFAGRVVGADFAEPMLKAGYGKTNGIPVSPVVADALDLPLPDDSAAGAIVAFGIRNVAAVSTFRVLRSTRTTSDDSGTSGIMVSPGAGSARGARGRITARYTNRPCASNPGVPFCPPMS